MYRNIPVSTNEEIYRMPQISEHMCCQNCYSLLQKMTVLETSFRTLLLDFKNWHSFAAQGLSECGSSGSGQQTEGLSKQRAVEKHRAGPGQCVAGAPNVSKADINTQNQQWICVGAKPKHRATYSSVVSSSTPASRAQTANANASKAVHLETPQGCTKGAKLKAKRSASLELALAASTPVNIARASNANEKRANAKLPLHLKNRYEPLLNLNDESHNNDQPPGLTTPSSFKLVGSRRAGPGAAKLNKPPRKEKGPSTHQHEPSTLVVGDSTVRYVGNRSIATCCLPSATVADVKEKLPDILANHRSANRIIIHVGTNDILQETSEILKVDFSELLDYISRLQVETFISGPLPAQGDYMFSRMLALNTWLQKTCSLKGLNYIENFNLFWGHKNLFSRDGMHLNRHGAKVLRENLLFALHHLPAPSPKGDTQTSFLILDELDTSSQSSGSPPITTHKGDMVLPSNKLASATPEEDYQEEFHQHSTEEIMSQPSPNRDTSQPLEMTKCEENSHHETGKTGSMNDFYTELNSNSSSTLSLSPHLGFSEKMNELVCAGTKLSFSFAASPKVPHKKRQAPLPPSPRPPPRSPRPCPPTDRALRPLPQRQNKQELLTTITPESTAQSGCDNGKN